MRTISLSGLNHKAFLAVFLLAGAVSAQTSTVAQPPTTAQPPQGGSIAPPPAGQWPNPSYDPNAGYYPPGQQPPPGSQPYGAAPPPGGDNSYFVPVQPSPNYDYFEEEDDPYYDDAGGSGSGGGKADHETKDSFRLVERPTTPVCKRWGNSLAGPNSFNDLGKCELELSRKVDQGYASIADLHDQFERTKLKKVIRKEISSRTEAKKYTVSFEAIRKSLAEASRKGCTCQSK